MEYKSAKNTLYFLKIVFNKMMCISHIIQATLRKQETERFTKAISLNPTQLFRSMDHYIIEVTASFLHYYISPHIIFITLHRLVELYY